MENIILKTAIGFLVLFMMGTGCEKEKEKDPGEFTEKQILKFSDFGCSNIFLKPAYIRNYHNHYVVTSQKSLEKYTYTTSDCIPQIDFSKYIVIIGSRGFSTGVSLYNEKAEENNVEIVYTVTFLTNDATVALGIQYHAVIEKPSGQKNIRVVEIVKDQV
jgi:hypothetical protein